MADELKINKGDINYLTPDQAWHYYIIPKEIGANKLKFFSKSDDELLKEELELLFGITIDLIVNSEENIYQSLVKYYPRSNHQTKNQVEKFANKIDDFLPKIIQEAKLHNSSDIHIEAFETISRIRFRIDGKLVERFQFNKNEYPALVNKVKIQANLDISEKRLPQDGRIFFRNGNEKIDIRVSILPTLYGEKVVLRLLNKDTANIALEKLGFSDHQFKTYIHSIQKPNGIVLISGPTGSGKTTTLYASLRNLNNENVNIMTIEDPVEYTLEGINQVHVREDIGLTFSAALRTFLRQDPDIIMLGEIRDQQTAQMAIRAALTGHLVFSTIHTNSAMGTISRLLDMGIPSYLVANTLNLSMAQRLLRLLCPHCKTQTELNHEMLPFKLPGTLTSHFVAKGCDKCLYTGYLGRKAIYELIDVNIEVAQKIKDGNFDESFDLKIPLLKDAALKVFLAGDTSLEEIFPYMLQ